MRCGWVPLAAAACGAVLAARHRAGRALRGRAYTVAGASPPSGEPRRARWRARLPRGGGRIGTARAARVREGRLPLATELLAACLAAGASPGEAAGAVGCALDGPVGDGLRRVAAELRLGSDPASAWARFGQLPGAAGLAGRLELAQSTGAPVAGLVAAEATASRARRLRAAQIRARRAAVYVTGPLGLCFLPAFLLVGVAPVVLGMARELL
jgi:pilus assembly protein TadC